MRQVCVTAQPFGSGFAGLRINCVASSCTLQIGKWCASFVLLIFGCGFTCWRWKSWKCRLEAKALLIASKGFLLVYPLVCEMRSCGDWIMAGKSTRKTFARHLLSTNRAQQSYWSKHFVVGCIDVICALRLLYKYINRYQKLVMCFLSCCSPNSPLQVKCVAWKVDAIISNAHLNKSLVYMHYSAQQNVLLIEFFILPQHLTYQTNAL